MPLQLYLQQVPAYYEVIFCTMQIQHETFQRFGKTFQEKLCHLMIQDRPFCDQISEVLDLEFLQYEYLRVFVEILRNYREKYRTHPNYDIMATQIKVGLDKYTPALQKLIRNFYVRVLTSEKVEEAEFIKDHALEFCRKQQAIRHAVNAN